MERANNTVKALNDLNKKYDTLNVVLVKLNEYYEGNLKLNSVNQMAHAIKAFEEKLEGKANTLDVKKLIPRIRKY